MNVCWCWCQNHVYTSYPYHLSFKIKVWRIKYLLLLIITDTVTTIFLINYTIKWQVSHYARTFKKMVFEIWHKQNTIHWSAGFFSPFITDICLVYIQSMSTTKHQAIIKNLHNCLKQNGFNVLLCLTNTLIFSLQQVSFSKREKSNKFMRLDKLEWCIVSLKLKRYGKIYYSAGWLIYSPNE